MLPLYAATIGAFVGWYRARQLKKSVKGVPWAETAYGVLYDAEDDDWEYNLPEQSVMQWGMGYGFGPELYWANADTDAYAMAYNEGHSDGRNSSGYKPSFSSREDKITFRDAWKLKSENYGAEDRPSWDIEEEWTFDPREKKDIRTCAVCMESRTESPSGVCKHCKTNVNSSFTLKQLQVMAQRLGLKKPSTKKVALKRINDWKKTQSRFPREKKRDDGGWEEDKLLITEADTFYVANIEKEMITTIRDGDISDMGQPNQNCQFAVRYNNDGTFTFSLVELWGESQTPVGVDTYQTDAYVIVSEGGDRKRIQYPKLPEGSSGSHHIRFQGQSAVRGSSLHRWFPLDIYLKKGDMEEQFFTVDLNEVYLDASSGITVVMAEIRDAQGRHLRYLDVYNDFSSKGSQFAQLGEWYGAEQETLQLNKSGQLKRGTDRTWKDGFTLSRTIKVPDKLVITAVDTDYIGRWATTHNRMEWVEIMNKHYGLTEELTEGYEDKYDSVYDDPDYHGWPVYSEDTWDKALTDLRQNDPENYMQLVIRYNNDSTFTFAYEEVTDGHVTARESVTTEEAYKFTYDKGGMAVTHQLPTSNLTRVVEKEINGNDIEVYVRLPDDLIHKVFVIKWIRTSDPMDESIKIIDVKDGATVAHLYLPLREYSPHWEAEQEIVSRKKKGKVISMIGSDPRLRKLKKDKDITPEEAATRLEISAETKLEVIQECLFCPESEGLVEIDIEGYPEYICEYCLDPTNWAEDESWEAENWGGDPDGILAKALAKARDKIKDRKPLNITKLPDPHQKSLKDFEEFNSAVVWKEPKGIVEKVMIREMAMRELALSEAILELEQYIRLGMISEEEAFRKIVQMSQ